MLKVFLRNLLETRKLLISIAVFSVIPAVVVNMLYYSQIQRQIAGERKLLYHDAIQRVQHNIEQYISEAVDMSLRFRVNEDLNRLMDRPYAGKYQFFIEYQNSINGILSSSLAYLRQVDLISVCTDNPTVLMAKNIIYAPEKDNVYYNPQGMTVSRTPLNEGVSLELLREQNALYREGRRYISIVTQLNHFKSYSHYHKLLRTDINLSVLLDELNTEGFWREIYILDNMNRIVCRNSSDLKNIVEGSFTVFDPERIGGTAFLVEAPFTLPSNWRIVGVFDENALADSFAGFRWQVAFITLGTLVMAFLLMRILIENEYKHRMKRQSVELEKKRTELRALQSQVNPHFLFNALEALRMKSLVKNEKETASMILRMSRMFRRMITWDADWVTVAEEFYFAKDFLELQKYRFGQMLTYRIDMPEEAANTYIPKFMIQPLVENACVHGFQIKTELSEISLSGRSDNNRLIFTVCDNGDGMSAEALAALRISLDQDNYAGKSVGIKNIYKRLSFYYGNDFSLDIDSVEGQYTRVTISVASRVSPPETT